MSTLTKTVIAKKWDKICDYLPPLSTSEKESLKESIKKYGVKTPILVLEDGRIVDGHHRWDIANELGVEYPTIFVGLSDEDAFALAISLNIDRRQLSANQIKVIRDRQKKIALQLRKQGKTQVEVAYIVGVTQQALAKWEDINNTTGCNVNTPDLRVRIPKIEHQVIATRASKGETQEQIASDYKVGRTRISQIIKSKKKEQQYFNELKKNSGKIPDTITLYLGDFQKQAENIPDESVQLILTDPPYSEEYLPLWDDLAIMAQRVLVEGGYLISYCPHIHLSTIVNKLQQKLEYFWIMALKQKESKLVKARNVYCCWKPIIIFYKPHLKLPINYFDDLIDGTGREKGYYEWQQAEKELVPIIETFCPKEGVVLDPMAGSGTTLKTAFKLERKCIGIEQDEVTFNIMKGRLLQK